MPASLNSLVTQFENDAKTIRAIIHGPAAGAQSKVQTTGGEVPTLARIAQQFAAPANAANIGFRPNGDESIVVPLSAILSDSLSPRYAGSLSDGLADDWVALQAMVNLATGSTGTAGVLKGGGRTYALSKQLAISGDSDVTLKDFKFRAIGNWPSGTDGAVIKVARTGGTDSGSRSRLIRIVVDCNNTAKTGVLVDSAGSGTMLESVRCLRFSESGFWLKGSGNGNNDVKLTKCTALETGQNEGEKFLDYSKRTAIGFFVDSSADMEFTNCTGALCKHGLVIAKLWNGSFTACKFWNGPVRTDPNSVVVRIEATAKRVQFANCRFDDGAVRLHGFNHQFTGCQFIQFPSGEVQLVATAPGEVAAKLTMVGNVIEQGSVVLLTEGAGTWGTIQAEFVANRRSTGADVTLQGCTMISGAMRLQASGTLQLPGDVGTAAVPARVGYFERLEVTHADHVSVTKALAFGDGTIQGDKIQSVLDAVANAGGGVVWMPPGLYLLDSPLQVPGKVHLIGSGAATVLKVVGNDTHGRNSAIFGMFASGPETINFPCAVAIEGSNASVQNLTLDGNGHNNYAANPDYGGINDWLQETRHLGICGIRIGCLNYRASAAVPARKVRNSFVSGCRIINCSWGAVTIQGQLMNKIIGGGESEADLYGVEECWVEKCHFEFNNSNTIQVNGVVNVAVRDNTIISPYHAGVKCYTRVKGATIERNTIICDEARQRCWDPRQVTVAAYRERELATRSEMICVGHSDYNTTIENVTVRNNKVMGNGVGVMHGVIVYGGARNIKVHGNHISGVIRGLTFTYPESVDFTGNTVAATSYTTTTLDSNTEYGGVDVSLYGRTGEVDKTVNGNLCRVVISGNTLRGAGVSNVRFSSFDRLNAQGFKASIRVSGNVVDLNGIAAYGATPANPVLVSGTVTAGGGVLFEGNSYPLDSGDASYFSVFTSISSAVRVRDRFEGTFTPVAVGSTTAGAATYTAQLGSYTVHNGRLNFELQLGWSAHTGTGDLRIKGLPFTPRAGAVTTIFAVGEAGLAYTGQIAAQTAAGIDYIYLYGQLSDAGVSAIQVDALVNTLRITGSFQI